MGHAASVHFPDLESQDQHRALKALVDSISQKDKRLPNKAVLRIDQTNSGVSANCEDGSFYNGNVVVGCDGVDSKASTRRLQRTVSEGPRQNDLFIASNADNYCNHDGRTNRNGLYDITIRKILRHSWSGKLHNFGISDPTYGDLRHF
ncbi:hypothetical protein PENFLA_c002G05660 [Penicillium flavigenum]|uniref:FAD-binding domain-containing protein n=1 Tax=Penicillium flavigenum TaxID=254877 RepID=A0A1V6TWE4_9EURO|nr:hypothetical protein PENFLA_c002G05660 [Penicillium flavigenum]